MPHGRPPKYHPLADYLAALPPEATTVTLTLPQIEAILGAPLPRSAWHREWWANARRMPSSQARAWMDTGWCVTARSLRSVPPAITFERAADSTHHPSA